MGNAVSMERLNCRRGQPGDIGELHAIFDMNRSHAARLQSPQQLRGEEVHLLEELIIVRVVPEVIVAGAVLIVVTERNRGHIESAFMFSPPFIIKQWALRGPHKTGGGRSCKRKDERC